MPVATTLLQDYTSDFWALLCPLRQKTQAKAEQKDCGRKAEQPDPIEIILSFHSSYSK